MKKGKYKTLNCGDIITWHGSVARVISTGDGKFVGIEVLEDGQKDKCPNCGVPLKTQFDVIESSPLCQENVEILKSRD